MMIAAVVSSRCAPRMRPTGLLRRCRSRRRVICGMTATPVSKPERPSASFGKTISAMPTMTSGLPCCAVSAAHQSPIDDRVARRRGTSATTMTTAFSAR